MAWKWKSSAVISDRQSDLSQRKLKASQNWLLLCVAVKCACGLQKNWVHKIWVHKIQSNFALLGLEIRFPSPIQIIHSPVTTAERRAPHTSSHWPLPSLVSRQRTRMRFNFPQYLFPAFLFRQHQLEQDPSPNSKKRSKPDDAVQAAGEASFTYLVCKGCHTPCTLLV